MKLFQPISIGGVTIANRIVKSAMAEGRVDAGGRAGESLVRLYRRWAKGGVGLAITGMAHVRQGYSFGQEMGLYDDSLIEPLRAVTGAVHEAGGRIFAQICHAPPQIPRERARELGAVGPSAGFCFTNWLPHRALRSDELASLVGDFGAAARRAREADCDGVQLHAAHGYLLSRMLSPLLNRRRDRWGGSFEGRLTFMREILAEIRCQAGDDFPVMVKLNAHDAVPGGLDVRTALAVACRLEDWGVDAIEVSAGIGDVGLGCYPNRGDIPVELGREFIRRELPFMRPALPYLGPVIRWAQRSVRFEEEAYFFDLARQFAEALSIPVICVGGIRSLAVAERILQSSRVAMVSLARPLVRQPALPRQWQQGRSSTATCVSCNKCFVQIGLGQPLRCWHRGR